jgi:predicted thioesterase
VAISFLGLEEARVLATPQMIRYMEWTSRNLVLPLLDDGYDTVGTHVNVYHRAAAPIGSVVTFMSEISAPNGSEGCSSSDAQAASSHDYD